MEIALQAFSFFTGFFYILTCVNTMWEKLTQIAQLTYERKNVKLYIKGE